MHYAPPADRPPILRNIIATVAAARDERAVREDRFDASRRYLPKELEVGDTTYQLRSQFLGTYLPGHLGKQGEFAVPQFEPYFVGRGWNADEAFSDWTDKLHCRFQELYAKRPFELTEEDGEVWRTLESLIDVAAYRRTTPLMIRQIGKVSRARPRPEQIQWEDGQKEMVRLHQMPGEFAAFKAGQPFEAVVARDPVNFSLMKVTHVQKLRSLPSVTAEEREALLQAMPTTASLPEADWD